MSSQNKLLQEVSKHIKTLASTDAKNGQAFKHAKVTDVKEFKFTDDNKNQTSALVVYMPYPYYKDHQAQVKQIINYLMQKRQQHAFVVAKRTVIHKRSDYKQKIPQNRTLTAVYDAVLEDLLVPGQIVGKRTRVRLDGTHLLKV